jgi:hypothetical protein
MPVRTRRLDRSPAIPAVCVTHGATVWLSTPAVNGPRVYIPSARKEATSSPTMSGPDTSAADSRVDRPAAGDREGRYFDPATGGGRDQTCASFVIRDQRQAGREGSAPDGIGAADLARWPRMATCGGRSRPRAPAFGRSRSVTRTRLPGVDDEPLGHRRQRRRGDRTNRPHGRRAVARDRCDGGRPLAGDARCGAGRGGLTGRRPGPRSTRAVG